MGNPACGDGAPAGGQGVSGSHRLPPRALASCAGSFVAVGLAQGPNAHRHASAAYRFLSVWNGPLYLLTGIEHLRFSKHGSARHGTARHSMARHGTDMTEWHRRYAFTEWPCMNRCSCQQADVMATRARHATVAGATFFTSVATALQATQIIGVKQVKYV